eukprot:sb/3468794/
MSFQSSFPLDQSDKRIQSSDGVPQESTPACRPKSARPKRSPTTDATKKDEIPQVVITNNDEMSVAKPTAAAMDKTPAAHVVTITPESEPASKGAASPAPVVTPSATKPAGPTDVAAPAAPTTDAVSSPETPAAPTPVPAPAVTPAASSPETPAVSSPETPAAPATVPAPTVTPVAQSTEPTVQLPEPAQSGESTQSPAASGTTTPSQTSEKASEPPAQKAATPPAQNDTVKSNEECKDVAAEKDDFFD